VITNNYFQDKVVAVTGGAQGIGLCLVHTFARQGAKISFCDINAKTGRFWEQKLVEAGADVLFTQADLGQETGARKFFRKTFQKYKRADILINNAGVTAFGQPFLKRPLKEWNRILSVNLTSHFLCSQLFAPELIKTKGNIINIASTRALMSEPDTDPYTASKGGVAALTHSLAITLGKHGVRVNAISPGWIDTSKWQNPPAKPNLRKKDHDQHPAGRVGKPQDIAEACLFLASPHSAGFITGQNLVVDGGMTKKMIYEG